MRHSVLSRILFLASGGIIASTVDMPSESTLFSSLKPPLVSQQRLLRANHNYRGRVVAAQKWSRNTFPNPNTDASTCRTRSPRICDPDGILANDNDDDYGQTVVVESAIAAFEKNQTIQCRAIDNDTDNDDAGTHIQMAVALVHQLNLSQFSWSGYYYQDAVDDAIQDFAMGIRNDWDVGSQTDCGGTGIVLAMSVVDDAISISVGAGVEPFLTEYRLVRVIDAMRPHFQNNEYSTAISTGISIMSHYMNGGPPSRMENFRDDYGGFIVLFGLLCFIYLVKLIREKRLKRQYARVHTSLNRIDRDRAQALQVCYKCTSCPICLEDFQLVQGNDNVITTSTTESSGCQEEQLSITTSIDGTDTNNNSEEGSHHMVGSDGLELTLLRCGHAFDATCWKGWVASGRAHHLRRCPICKQDIATSLSLPLSCHLDDNTL